MGAYYDADRAYVFELNAERTHASNTCEWCREGVLAEIGNLQNIPLEGMECWFEAFEEEGEFFISSLAEGYGPESKTYQILEPQGIESLMAAPIVVNGAVIGFLGVDNPRRNTGDLLLLSVVASTCYSEISTKRMVDSTLEQTGKELTDRMKIIQSMSEIYSSVYYIDMATGLFSEISSLEKVHSHIGAAGGAQERLNYFCHHLAAPECTEELLDFVNLSTLNQRMEHTRIVSKQYKSTLIPAPEDENAASWRECSFIEGDRQLFDRVRTVAGVNALLANKKAYYFNYRVSRNGTVQYFQCQLVKPNRDRNEFVVAFKNVDEEKKQELAQQRKLEEAFAALEQVNESLAGVRRLPCAACGGQ